MHTLDFYIELKISSEPAMILKKTVKIPFVPTFGMVIETDTISIEINRLGYSLKDTSFFVLLEDQEVEMEDLSITSNYWKASGFEETDLESFKKKEVTVG